MPEKLRIGVLGMAHDHLWSNLQDLGKLEDAALVAGADGSAGLREAFVERTGCRKVYENYEELLDGEQPDQLVLTGLRIGRRLPVHCTALGKVLLGCGDELIRERFDRLCVTNGSLRARTDTTITDRDKFFEHLRSVASQGFALDLEESETGLCCIAAPVFTVSGRLVAALSVSGPSFRLSRDTLLDQIAPTLLSAADDLSRQLGYQGYQE